MLPPVMKDLETIKYDFPDFAATALCQETSVQKRQAREKNLILKCSSQISSFEFRDLIS